MPTVELTVENFEQTINDNDFDVVVEFSERILVVDSIGVAGMCDLVLRHRATGELFVADLKTGSSEICVFDAAHVSDGPLCIWRSDHAWPLGFHGTWA